MGTETGSLEQSAQNNGVSDGRPIVYISSALSTRESSTFDYFTSLVSNLVWSVQRILKKDLVVKVPETNITRPQIDLLDEVLDHREKYASMIIAPIESEEVRTLLNQRINSFDEYRKCPIFSIDKPVGIITEQNIEVPSVYADWYKGGYAAGEAAKKIFRKNPDLRDRKVLILKGLEGSEKRIQGFEDACRTSKIPMVIDVTEDPPIDFSREGALDRIIDEYSESLQEYSVIFACNDEMALGVREAILSLRQDDHSKVEQKTRFRILGFDGTNEFVRLQKKPGELYLHSTANVHVAKQALRLATIIERYNKDADKVKSAPKRFLSLIPPQMTS